MEKKVRCIPEIKYYRFQLILMTSVFLILMIPIISLMIRYNASDEVLLLLGVVLFGFVPIIGYYTYRLIYFLRLQPTQIQIVSLEKVESMSRMCLFIVDMVIDGRNAQVPTLAVFAPGILGPNRVDVYSQKTVRVGYDRRRAIAVVVDLMED